jgi:hypothetical protein
MINNTNNIIKNVENPSLVGMGQANKNATNAEARFSGHMLTTFSLPALEKFP